KTGDSFQTPEVVMVYSNEGLNTLSQTYHELYNHRLIRGNYRLQERPTLINNWEATYFDFNEEKIMNIVDDAKNLGIEMFVLDDG
ncbi:alpha-galactosidase, partial [Enterococcus faecium]